MLENWFDWFTTYLFFSLWSYRGSTHFNHFGTLERTCAKTCRISLRSALWWSPVATLGVTIVAVLCGVQVNMLGSPFKQLQQWSRYLTYCRKLQFEEGKGPLTLVMVQRLQDESLWLCNILTGVLCEPLTWRGYMCMCAYCIYIEEYLEYPCLEPTSVPFPIRNSPTGEARLWLSTTAAPWRIRQGRCLGLRCHKQ